MPEPKTKHYAILAHYYTGDSYGSEDRDEELDLMWDKLDVAEENLNRIREHYTYYRAVERLGERHGKVTALCESRPWYVPKHGMALFLVTDDGKQIQLSAPWCGYFGGLHGAEVVVAKERLPSFTL